MADNETSYLPIGTCLEQIEKAVYGREVRQAIHDGIAQCYDDTVEGVNAAQQAASDTQNVIDNAVTATNAANTAATEASNVKVEQAVSGDTVTFTTTKRDGTTVSTSFQKPNIMVSKDEGSGEFSVTAKGWNGEEIVAKIPDPSEEVKSRATIAAVSKVKTALGNPMTITDGMDAPAVKTVVTLEPKQDLHGYDHPWVGGAGKNKLGISGTWDANGNPVNANNGIRTELLDVVPGQICTAYKDTVLEGGAYNMMVRKFDTSGTFVGSSQLLTYNSVGFVQWTVPTNVYKIGVVQFINPSFDISTIKLMFTTEVVTSYEPYSNICPIEGYDTVRVTATGKNLYNKKDYLDAFINTSSALIVSNANAVTVFMECQPNTTYTLSKFVGTRFIFGETSVKPTAGAAVSNIKSTGSAASLAITTTSSAKYVVAFVWLSTTDSVTKTEALDSIQIELGDVATGYEPFGNSTSLSVAQAAGATVYGGTVTLNEDGSGTLVVDRVKAVITEATSGLQYDTNNRLYIPATAMLGIKGATSSNDIADATSNQFACVTTNGTYNNTTEGFAVAPSGACYLYSSKFASLDAWKTHLQANNLEIEGALTTPTTYTLTADQLRTLTGENHVWTDGTKLELTYRADKYADADKFLNAIPTGTKTGNPAVFADGADDLPFEKLTIAVEPHQEGSGDPSPDNIRPITGWDEVKVTRCGKNLLENHCKVGQVTENGITWTVNKDGSVVINGTSTGNTYLYLTETGGMTLKPGTYTRFLGSDKSFSGIRLNCRIGSAAGADAFGTAPDAQTATISEDTVLVVRLSVPSGNTYSNITVYPMIVSGTYTTATFPVWEPYTSTALPISLKYATGSTVYGGTVTINRDGTGSVVVDRGFKQYSSGWGMASSVLFIDDTSVPHDSKVQICNKYLCEPDKSIGAAAVAKNYPQKLVNQNITIGGNSHTRWLVYDTAYESADAFNAAIANNPIQIVYKLATPTTYTLTAPQLTSLLGNNTVWCDAGQVTVKYKRDIGKMISNLYALMVDTGVIVIENEEDVTVEGPHYNP